MKLFINLFIFFALSGCAGKNIDLKNNKLLIKGKLSLHSTFLKDKVKKFDIGITGNSLTGTNVLLDTSAIVCGKGSTIGEVKKVGKVKGPEIVLKTNDYTSFYIVCSVDTKSEGNFYVTFNEVWSTQKDTLMKDANLGTQTLEVW